MCNCKNLNEFFEGMRVEDVQQLRDSLQEIKTDFKKWETLYRCKDCGQFWLEKFEQKGHGEMPTVRKILPHEMTDIQNIQAVLARMVELLRFGGIKDWADALEKFHGEVTNDPSATWARILSFYGGMGSLNDLILCKDGTPLVKENTELDTLRSKLYDLCHE